MVLFKTTLTTTKPNNNNNNNKSTNSKSNSTTTRQNSHQSPPPPPPSSSSLYNNIDRGYLANSEQSSSSFSQTFSKLLNNNRNNNMGNAQATGENSNNNNNYNNYNYNTNNNTSSSISNKFTKKQNKPFNYYDDDKASEVIEGFDPSMMLSKGRRSSLTFQQDEYLPPQQQSTGFYNNRYHLNESIQQQQQPFEYILPQQSKQQQSTGEGFKALPNMKRKSSVASAGSTGNLGYIDTNNSSAVNFVQNVNNQQEEEQYQQGYQKEELFNNNVDFDFGLEKLSKPTLKTTSKAKSKKEEKKPSKKKQEIGNNKKQDDDEEDDEIYYSDQSDNSKTEKDNYSKSGWIDRHRSIPTFDTAFTTTRIYFKYDEYNLPAIISDQSNLIQIINEIKLKFKQLQNQDDSNIQISYDTNEIKNILVLDDESILEMIKYFKSIDSITSRIIKINLNNINNNNINNNLNNLNNLNNIRCKFSAEYITSTLEKATKNFVLKISYSEPLQKFISDVADKCSLVNGSGLYIIQFYDKAFNDYIDINDLNEMDLDLNGINLIKIKKSISKNNILNNNSNGQQTYSNAFIGLIINNKYIITESLGRGGQGCVFACQDLITKKDYAIKFIISNGQIEQEQDAKKEAIFMEKLQHENIAKVEGVFTWNEILNNSPDLNYNMLFTPLLCILMERYFYGNIMQSIIIDRGLKINSLNLFLIFKIIFQTSKALSFIHDRQIIHRDIKPHNILIKSFDSETNDISIVLSDFGTAKDNIHTTHHTHIGTLLFESPEVMLHRTYGLSADLYSLGVTLFQLLSLNINFNSTFKLIQNEKDCFTEMDELILKNYQFYNFKQNEKELLNSLIEILHKLMKLSPQDRLTAKELVEQLDILELEFNI